MPVMDLTPDEARHIRRRRTSEKRDMYFEQGLEAAAEEVKLWDGVMSTGERMALCRAILALKRNRKPVKEKLP